MFFFRISACLLCLIALIAPVHGQQAVLWDIGPSAVFEDRVGSSNELRLAFQTPGGDYAAQGATAGASLFEGERDGQTVTGMAWAFTPRCPAESYEVTGSLSTDGKVLFLKGREPIKDSACKVTTFQDKTLTFTKRSAVANVPAAPPVSPVTPPPPAPPSASVPGRSYWAHNGSTLYLVVNGTSRELYYDKPRPGMLVAGAQPGSLLFRGIFSNGSYTGTAYIFNKRCGTLPYQVSGPVSNNYEQITLRGQAPVADATCNIAKYIPDTLEFALCVKTLPPGANALLCP